MYVWVTGSRALCCFPLVKKQKHDIEFFVKQSLAKVFVISRIIKVSVRIILTSTLIILVRYHKTPSNNCLIFEF